MIEIMRFINRDPIGEAGGENLYAFVGNDPINGRDFLGLRDIACESRCHTENPDPRKADECIKENCGGNGDDDIIDLPPVYGQTQWLPAVDEEDSERVQKNFDAFLAGPTCYEPKVCHEDSIINQKGE